MRLHRPNSGEEVGNAAPQAKLGRKALRRLLLNLLRRYFGYLGNIFGGLARTQAVSQFEIHGQVVEQGGEQRQQHHEVRNFGEHQDNVHDANDGEP